MFYKDNILIAKLSQVPTQQSWNELSIFSVQRAQPPSRSPDRNTSLNRKLIFCMVAPIGQKLKKSKLLHIG